MRNTPITGLTLIAVLWSGLSQIAGAADIPSGEAGVTLPTGLIMDRLTPKQLRVWRAMEQIVLERDSAGQPLRPLLHELYDWAKTSNLPIYIEMPKAEGRWDYAAGECVFERQPEPPGRRLVAVTICLYTTIIDRAPGRRISGEQGFMAYEGLTGEKRYCETVAHELAHVRQSVTDPEFLQLTETQRSLNDEILRLLPLRLLPGRRQSVTNEMRAIADRLNVLSERIEGPALAVEQQVWRELSVR